jgi:hypothetical protein
VSHAANLPKSEGNGMRDSQVNAHCCAMRLQRRLSSAFAAAGHPALRPHSLAHTSQMPELLVHMAEHGRIGVDE